MSALQLRWVNYHFAHGNISREEFASLRKRIAQSEQAGSGDVISQRKILRLHPQTRRMLAQIRVFRSVARVASYFLLLAMISVAYIVADHYRNTGSLEGINAKVFEKYFTQAWVKPLPSDIRLAAQQLTSESGWPEKHINQFMLQWQSLDKTQQQSYLSQDWFHSFTLALSLHIADQRALAKQGDKTAIKRQLALVKLAEVIERGSV